MLDIEGEDLNYEALVEAYCLLSSYIREDGKVGAKYDMDYLKQFTVFLSKVMTDPRMFPENHVAILPERNDDGSLKFPHTPDHDGTGLA